MNSVTSSEINTFVNTNIDGFHQNKAKILKALGLKKILRSKNPYLFKAKNLNSANELINDILAAFLSSSEEKLFGDFLEKLALFISERTCNGYKSSAPGIDLEFKEQGVHYVVSVKSGPSWGNSSSVKRLEQNFQNAVAVLKQANYKVNVTPVLGICYGKTKTTFVRGYMKVTGQSFWGLISGDKELYKQIIEPIGYRAKEHNEAFVVEKNRILNVFTQEFVSDFCDDGIINWIKLVEFNSGNSNKDANTLI